MFNSRKLKIWLLSLAVLIALFVLYNMVSQTPEIKIARRVEFVDSNTLQTDTGTGQIGQVQLGNIEEARFVTLDKKTKEVKRVLGFAKVLHKSGDQWNIDRPFMNIFEDDFRYDLTAEAGSIQVETVSGKPSPQDAVLTGNVVVHIVPTNPAGSVKEGYIYLDDITYDSDRSMFTTPGPVRYISDDAELMGKGLEILYDNQSNRLVMLKIIRPEFLRVKLSDESEPIAKSTPKATPRKNISADTAKPSEPRKAAQPVDDQKYICSFTDNVVIEHDRLMVFANEITISDILWSDKKGKAPRKTTSAYPPPPEPIPSPVSIYYGATKPKTAPVMKKPQTQEPTKVLITCDGPMIVQLAKDYKPPKNWNVIKTFANLTEEAKEKIKNKDVLIAQSVDHNLKSEITEAIGPLEIYSYTKSGQQEISSPAKITAAKSASFIPHLNRAIFTGDVVGSIIDKTPYYDEENVFYGQQLTIDLAKDKSSQQDSFGDSAIKHITLSGGRAVILKSTRRADEKILSQTRLACAQLDFDKNPNQITTTGAGQIQINRPVSSNGQEKPCVALVEGFDRLNWNMDSMKITIDSNTTSGIHVGYMPIVDGEYAKMTKVDTRHIEIDYTEPTPGRGELKRLLATGGVFYYEQDNYEFQGERLFYNAENSYMVVTGDNCRLNGLPAKGGIQYNLRSGYAQAMLGPGVGTLPTKKEK